SRNSGMGQTLGDPQLERGLFDDLTVYSAEPETSSTGTARINVNDNNNQRAVADLMRELFGAQRGAQLILRSQPRPRPFANIIDFARRTQMTADEVDMAADAITFSSGTQATQAAKGRINLTT